MPSRRRRSNKTAWADAGLSWRGHTDLLAELTGASDVAMMFYAERLRVVLATVHVPLVEVSGTAHAPAGRTDDRAGARGPAAVRVRDTASRAGRTEPHTPESAV